MNNLDPKAIQAQVISDVLAERQRQDAKWGQQDNDPFIYLAVLVEEVGELAQSILHCRFGGHAAASLRTEAIHTAAVALALVECLDRGLWVEKDESDEIIKLRTALMHYTTATGVESWGMQELFDDGKVARQALGLPEPTPKELAEQLGEPYFEQRQDEATE